MTTYGHYGSIVNLHLDEAAEEANVLIVETSSPAPKADSSDLTIICNSMNALLGVGMFVLPWGFLQSGFVGGTVVIFVVSYVSFDTCRVLLVAQRTLCEKTGEVKSYPEITSSILGEQWCIIVKVATVVSCMGACISYLIFYADLFSQLFQIPYTVSVFMSIGPLILLSWIRTFEEIALFTLLGIFATIAAIATILYDGMVGDVADATISSIPIILPTSLFKFVGPATFIFTIHYCVLSMGEEALSHYSVMHHQQSFLNNESDDPESFGLDIDTEEGGDETDYLTTEHTPVLNIFSSPQFQALQEDQSDQYYSYANASSRPSNLHTTSDGHENHDTESGPKDLVRPMAIAFICVAVVAVSLGVGGLLLFQNTPILRYLCRT